MYNCKLCQKHQKSEYAEIRGISNFRFSLESLIIIFSYVKERLFAKPEMAHSCSYAIHIVYGLPISAHLVLTHEWALSFHSDKINTYHHTSIIITIRCRLHFLVP